MTSADGRPRGDRLDSEVSRAVASWLKHPGQGKLGAALEEAMIVAGTSGRLGQQALADLRALLADLVVVGVRADAAAKVRRLAKLGLARSADLLFRGAEPSLADARSALLVAPSAASVKVVVRNRQDANRIVLDLLETSPDLVYASAVGDWAASSLAPSRCAELLWRSVGSGNRPAALAAPHHLASTILERDSKAVLLRALLSRALGGKVPMAATWLVCLRVPQHLRACAEWIVSADASASGLDAWLQMVHALEGVALAGSPSLSRPATLVLACVRSLVELGRTASRDGLDAQAVHLARFTQGLMTSSAPGDSVTTIDPWMLCTAGEVAGDQAPSPSATGAAEPMISRHAAEEVAHAVRQIRSGLPPASVAEALALNLGLEVVGNPGEVLAFDPFEHEARDSGPLPGDPVTIVVCGWRVGAEVVLRAEVQPAS